MLVINSPTMSWCFKCIIYIYIYIILKENLCLVFLPETMPLKNSRCRPWGFTMVNSNESII